MRLGLAFVCLGMVVPAPLHAFEVVTERAEFVSLVQGKDLRIGLFGIALQVDAGGQITGTAQGQVVSGSWSWENGLFCRDMRWGMREIPYNCQLVEVEGGQMRFTTDAGAGMQATFNLR